MKILKDMSIFNILSNIPKDKLLHFFYGFLIMILLSLFLPKTIVVISLLLIAVAKEIRDKFKNGSVELLDVLFTILPLSSLYVSNFFT